MINAVYYVVGIICETDYDREDGESARVFYNFEDAEQYQFKLENEGSYDYVELTQTELN